MRHRPCFVNQPCFVNHVPDAVLVPVNENASRYPMSSIEYESPVGVIVALTYIEESRVPPGVPYTKLRLQSVMTPFTVVKTNVAELPDCPF